MKRVEAELRARGKSLADFARAIGVSNQTITNWKKRQIPGSKYQRVAEYLGWTVEELLAGGPSRVHNSPTANQPRLPGAEWVPIQHVTIQLAAGETGFTVAPASEDGPPLFFPASWMAHKGYSANHLYALQISDDSMEPGLWAGDIVVFNMDDTEPKDGEVFLINYEGLALIRRLIRDAGSWWLASDNVRHRQKRLDDHALIIGRVVHKQSERV